MPVTTSLVSAIAAVLAAILAAANLYYSGRREQTRWARETLADLYVAYLDASFQSSRAARALQAQRATATMERFGENGLRSTIEQAHESQTAILTKLRLLSSRETVDAAVSLHEACHTVVEIALSPAESSQMDTLSASDGLWEARQRFLAAAKRTLGLKGHLANVGHEASAVPFTERLRAAAPAAEPAQP